MANRNRERKIGREAQRKGASDMSRLYLILGVVAVGGVAVVGYSVASGGGSATTEPVTVEGLDDPQRLVALAQGMVKGDEGAPVTIVEFGDYQCPGCGSFALVVEPQIEAVYVETGKAKFVYYDFPLTGLHANAFVAARAARCAMDQERGWEYHTVLFGNQNRWSGSSDPTGEFVDYAEELGLDGSVFESCIESDQHADVVTANLRLGEELGVSGTPTVLVSEGRGVAQRINLGGDPWSQISAEVDRILEARGLEGAPGTDGEGGGG